MSKRTKNRKSIGEFFANESKSFKNVVSNQLIFSRSVNRELTNWRYFGAKIDENSLKKIRTDNNGQQLDSCLSIEK